MRKGLKTYTEQVGDYLLRNKHVVSLRLREVFPVCNVPGIIHTLRSSGWEISTTMVQGTWRGRYFKSVAAYSVTRSPNRGKRKN